MKKINIAIIYGGNSTEHEVSINSAKNILSSLDKNKYKPFPIFINKNGNWLFKSKKINFLEFYKKNKIKIAFPILHGINGEDGTIQGFLKLFKIPFIGCDVLSSAMCMDKEITKKILLKNEIKITDYIVYKKTDKNLIDFNFIKNKLGLPFFIKPVNSGSSIGISKISNNEDFQKKIDHAFLFDKKIMFEKAIFGKEIEISVLGTEDLIISTPCEIIPKNDFYDYKAKYDNKNGTIFKIPADLSKNTICELKKIAQETFKILECEGMARIDFFINKNNEIFLNEVNTIPGFTKNSMYPKMLNFDNINNQTIIDTLIKLTIKKFNL